MIGQCRHIISSEGDPGTTKVSSNKPIAFLGVDASTLVCADPSRETEEFDNFIAACPADLREGFVVQNGRRIQCPRLFDEVAIDFLGHDMAEYRKLTVALVLQALKVGTEVVAQTQPVKIGDLSATLREAAGEEVEGQSQQSISIIELSDI